MEYSHFCTVNYSSLRPSEKYDYFIDKITEAVRSITPQKREVHHTIHENPVRWWDAECKKVIRLKKSSP